MKSSFYLKHDLDARDKDPNMRAMIMKLGARGSGIYWWIVEDLYKNNGRIPRDYSSMSWTFRETQQEIKSVVEDFGLFYDVRGKIACHQVDRDLYSRREASEQARLAGLASAANRQSNGRSTTVQPGEERRGEEGKERTEQPHGSPSAVDLLVDGIGRMPPKDFHAWRFPKGFNAKYAGAYLMNVPADECSMLLNTQRLGAEIKAALEWRIAEKKRELSR